MESTMPHVTDISLFAAAFIAAFAYGQPLVNKAAAIRRIRLRSVRPRSRLHGASEK
jgi:hypothetical protein